MSRRLLISLILVVVALGIAQAAYAQAPPVYYGQPPPGAYTPYDIYYLNNGVYVFDPYPPQGYTFSQPFMGLSVPSDLGGYISGPYATGSYATGSYLNGSYATGSYMTGSYASGSYVTGSYLGRRY
jgi:hypothetical protein